MQEGKFYRGRRLRKSEGTRQLARETTLSVKDLIHPIFVTEGKNVRSPVTSMEGIFRYSPDQLERELTDVHRMGIRTVLFFGVVDEGKKNSKASASWVESGPVQEAVRNTKKWAPEITVITDVCLCGYTDHGHCGYLVNGQIDNDASLEALAKMALSHAKAGADVVAPSDMMDGRVAAIRQALDENGFSELPILSYSAKYASAFYGPFREAAASSPKSGDRKGYQMDPSNVREAMREINADIKEGADLVMIKPALAYLDVIRAARERFDVPIVAYNVSGEYAMVKAASARGWVDEKAIVREILTSMKRAGADKIITYHSKIIAE